MMRDNVKRSFLLAMVIIGSMYAILGFSVGIDAFFVPFVQDAFQISTASSYLILTATFSAYVIFGFPTGSILKKVGYRVGIGISFLMIAIGFFIIGYSAFVVNFIVFLFALFVIGMGQTLLTSAINSYITIIGPPESAASRIAIMGVCDKTAYAGASLILALFLNLADVRIEDVTIPFYVITAIMVLIGIMIFFMPLPEIKAIGEEDNPSPETKHFFVNSKKSIVEFPHLILGTIAIFFDVGVEYLALGSINDYANILGLSSPQNYVWLVSGGMVFGYVIGIVFIPRYVSQSRALSVCASLGMVISLLIAVVPQAMSIYFVGLLGLSNSLLWPTVFPLSLEDLGRFTKRGSSILVMGIIGGAALPLVYGYFAEIISHQTAYLVCIPAYLFLLYFAVWGHKIRKSVTAVTNNL